MRGLTGDNYASGLDFSAREPVKDAVDVGVGRVSNVVRGKR